MLQKQDRMLRYFYIAAVCACICMLLLTIVQLLDGTGMFRRWWDFYIDRCCSGPCRRRVLSPYGQANPACAQPCLAAAAFVVPVLFACAVFVLGNFCNGFGAVYCLFACGQETADAAAVRLNKNRPLQKEPALFYSAGSVYCIIMLLCCRR